MRLLATILGLAAGLALAGTAGAQTSPSITIFQNEGFQGNYRSFSGPVRDLRNVGIDGPVSSAIVHSGSWRLCDRSRNHMCVTLAPGAYATLTNWGLNNQVASLAIAGWNWGGSGGGASSFYENGPPNPMYGDQRYYADNTNDDIFVATSDGGAGVSLFAEPGFSGNYRNFTGPASNLQDYGFADMTSSIVVRVGSWQFCTNIKFRPPCVTLGPGSYPDLGGENLPGRIISLRPV